METTVIGGSSNSKLKYGPQPPPLINTGPTIVGLVFKDGVIFGTYAGAMDQECERFQCIDSNIYCCVAGTVAGTEAIIEMFSEQLNLHIDEDTKRESRVTTALTLLKSNMFGYEGSAALLLGGVDIFGPQLHIVHSHGSTNALPFATMGAGYFLANGVFESKFKEGLNVEEGIQLVCEAIRSSSGSNTDVIVITRDHDAKFFRNLQLPIPGINVRARDHAVAKFHTGDSSQGSGQSQG